MKKIFILILYTASSLLSQDDLPGSFHYFKDYPRILHFVETSYLDKDLPDSMIFNSFQGMLWSVSEYYNLTQEKAPRTDWKAELLDRKGLEIIRYQNVPRVVRVVWGSPGHQAGLLEGDLLLEINQESTHDMSAYKIAQIILNTQVVDLVIRDSMSPLPENEHRILRGECKEQTASTAACDYLETASEPKGMGTLLAPQDLEPDSFQSLPFDSCPAMLLDMTGNFITTEEQLIEWVSFFFPGLATLVKQSKSGDQLEIEIPLDPHPFSGSLVLITDPFVSEWSEIFCHIAKLEGALIFGEETSGFPFGRKWIAVRENLHMEIAYWQYSCSDKGPFFEHPVQPDYRAGYDHQSHDSRWLQAIFQEISEVDLK